MSRSVASVSGGMATGPSIGQQMLNKVPEVTIFFWIIKVLATTVGETAADFLNFNLNWGLTKTTVVMCVLLIGVLAFQFRAKQYVAAIYWLTVVLISIVGTLITDNLVDNLGVPLETTTLFFAIGLAVTFVAWYSSEKTLSIHSITTTRREAFYWLAILFTFALGTAAGDLIAEGLGVGYFASAFLFGTLITLVAVAYQLLNLNSVLAFWIAYILTRPLGASLGDFLSQPQADGGLGLRTHAGFERVLFGIVESCRIEDPELQVADLGLAFAAVTRDAGLVVDQCDLAADQPVEERGLPDIWPPHDGDGDGHCGSLNVSLPDGGAQAGSSGAQEASPGSGVAMVSAPPARFTSGSGRSGKVARPGMASSR